MAKYGEGDSRWIVEDRSDGANVHNWHWSEKDCMPWAKTRLAELFQGCTVSTARAAASSRSPRWRAWKGGIHQHTQGKNHPRVRSPPVLLCGNPGSAVGVSSMQAAVGKRGALWS